MTYIVITNSWGSGLDMSGYNDQGWGSIYSGSPSGPVYIGNNSGTFTTTGFNAFDHVDVNYYYDGANGVMLEDLNYFKGMEQVLMLEDAYIATTLSALNSPVWTVRFNQGNDTFVGNDYNDYIRGGDGDDGILGKGGNDILRGDAGRDQIYGGYGNDIIDGGSGMDVAFFGGFIANFSVVRNADGSTTVTDTVGGMGSDTLYGIEVLHFDTGGEIRLDTSVAPPINIYGTAGADHLHGNALDNKLFGGNGRDMLWGESGHDAFVFDTSPKSGRDFIKDFRVVDDTIMLDNAHFTKVGGNGKLKAGAFHANLTGKAHDANDRVIYDKDSGKLYYDADGTGAKVGICFSDISKNLKLTAADFFVL